MGRVIVVAGCRIPDGNFADEFDVVGTGARRVPDADGHSFAIQSIRCLVEQVGSSGDSRVRVEGFAIKRPFPPDVVKNADIVSRPINADRNPHLIGFGQNGLISGFLPFGHVSGHNGTCRWVAEIRASQNFRNRFAGIDL